MNITLYIIRFLYRIRYQLIFGSVIVTGLVIYFSRFIPKTYTVKTTIYTGIVTDTGLNSDQQPANWKSVENMFDNLVKLTKEKGIQKIIAIKLLAINLVHGDPDADNLYIRAKNYKDLIKIIPEDLLQLVDKTSEKKTIDNFIKYMKNDPENFLYELLNNNGPFYSYNSLSTIAAKRLDNSDLIEISYQTADPGITLNTVKLIYEELRAAYEDIRYKATNDIVAYYEKELKRLQTKLSGLEDKLVNYNVENSVINYPEQTKAIANSYSEFENRYEATRRAYESANRVIQDMEQYMNTRTKLVKANDDFIRALNEISSVNGKITEIETFNSEEMQAKNTELQEYKTQLKNAEQKISSLTTMINSYKESKEGIAIDGLVDEWLKQTIVKTKAEAELNVLDQRRKVYNEQYKLYSPIGTQIDRQQREIKVLEQSYLQMLHALNMAKMKQKDIQLTSATLRLISEPTFPILSDKSKRSLLVIAAFMGSILFIIGFNLLIELLDRTLRDADRAKRLTGLPVLAAFTGHINLKYRGFTKASNRVVAAYCCNQLNVFLQLGQTSIINLISFGEQEGKGFIASYLQEYWEDLGFNVKIITYGKDYNSQSMVYALAHSIFNIYEPPYGQDNPDILIVKYPPLREYPISTDLLQEAQVNLLVADACRVWSTSDTQLLEHFRKQVKEKPLYLLLNRTEREFVEDFTGQLPPYSGLKNLIFRLNQFGITANKA
ncbi:hypothetical protein DW083_01600 [Parabacteroides sp. AF48-14]|uniref:GumC family protein n=1 Tax=Parabacteroides sp. AF48-14 TaxID=2292052 RepID=UPI000EFDDE27|nr:hypothetical protein [Parabacteroides sp. AF48-14]RHO74853.1 hypothetical protein DW083_01600 [Parabacteroides sp. AF48-14]